MYLAATFIDTVIHSALNSEVETLSQEAQEG